METREEWLTRAVEKIAIHFGPYGFDVSAETGEPMIDAVRVSVGFPRHPRYAKSHCLGGEVLPAKLSAANVHQIFIPPTIDDPWVAVRCLSHQLCHVAGPVLPSNGFPHGGVAYSYEDLAAELGPYPHVAVSDVVKVAATRLLLAQCPNLKCPERTRRGPWQFRITQSRAEQWLPECKCGTKVVLKEVTK